MQIAHPFPGSLQQYREATSDPDRYRPKPGDKTRENPGTGNPGTGTTLHTFRCPRRTTMLINRDEMIDEFERQIRMFGGAWGMWCVGTAKDARGPFPPI